MGRVLTAEECLKQAEDCRTLAESTSDADLRNEYLKLANNLSELASIIRTQRGVKERAAVPNSGPASKKGSPGSGLTS